MLLLLLPSRHETFRYMPLISDMPALAIRALCYYARRAAFLCFRYANTRRITSRHNVGLFADNGTLNFNSEAPCYIRVAFDAAALPLLLPLLLEFLLLKSRHA